MFTMAKECFYLPLTEKLIDTSSKKSYSGYIQMGCENLDSTNLELIDEKEAFRFGQSVLNNKDQLSELFSRDKNFKLLDE